MKASNIEKSRELARRLKLLGTPFILIGDMNMGHGQLLSGPLATLDPAVVLPTGVDSTCKGGSLMDYAIVSTYFKAAVELRQVLDVPWRPHIGIEMIIDKRPLAITARFLFRPGRFDTLLDIEDIVDGPNQICLKLNAAAREQPDSNFWKPEHDDKATFHHHWAHHNRAEANALGAVDPMVPDLNFGELAEQ